MKTIEKQKAISANGEMYEIIGEGKVRKLKSFSELSQLVTESEREMARHMKTLYLFLKEKDGTTVMKKDKIHLRDFVLGFSEAGFQIIDRLNFGKIREDFDNPCPTPREVWEFISKPKIIKATSTLEKELDEKLEARLKEIRKIKKLSPVEKAKKEREKEIEKAITKPEEVNIEDLRKKAIRIIQRNNKPNAIIEKITGLIPNRSYNVFFGKLVRSFENKEMRGAKFISELLELTKTISFEAKPEPAPKFIGIQFYDINELHYIKDDFDNVVIVRDKIGRFTISKSELMCRYLLSKRPKLVVAMMKFLRGTITKEQLFKEPFMKDRFEHFDINLLKSKSDYYIWENLCSDFGLENPLLKIYRNDVTTLKVGDKVEVYWIESESENWCFAKVCSIDTGIEVRYSDGYVKSLNKAQLWRKAVII